MFFKETLFQKQKLFTTCIYLYYIYLFLNSNLVTKQFIEQIDNLFPGFGCFLSCKLREVCSSIVDIQAVDTLQNDRDHPLQHKRNIKWMGMWAYFQTDRHKHTHAVHRPLLGRGSVGCVESAAWSVSLRVPAPPLDAGSNGSDPAGTGSLRPVAGTLDREICFSHLESPDLWHRRERRGCRHIQTTVYKFLGIISLNRPILEIIIDYFFPF